jgi:ketosteroid isomerase-like protein
MKRLGIAVLALISAAAVAGPADEVRCREIGFSKSIENRDLEAFRSFLDADARFVSDRPLRGIEEIASSWSIFIPADAPRIKWRPQFVEVLEDGSLALTRGPYRYTTKDEAGEELVFWGTFNSVWRKQDDGSWKVVFDAGGAAAEPPSDEVRALLDADDDCGS